MKRGGAVSGRWWSEGKSSLRFGWRGRRRYLERYINIIILLVTLARDGVGGRSVGRDEQCLL